MIGFWGEGGKCTNIVFIGSVCHCGLVEISFLFWTEKKEITSFEVCIKCKIFTKKRKNVTLFYILVLQRGFGVWFTRRNYFIIIFLLKQNSLDSV